MRSTRAHDSTTAESRLGEAANAWLECLARGESPEIEAYARRFPGISAVIRDVFPALRELQHCACAADVTGAPDSAPIAGVLGDFRLLRVIGRGGMGIVYEAEQISLGRRVALKVLPLAGLLEKHQLHRFRREAQAAAQLHHTHITPVFAVGCERGVHYYAMQYIEGCPLSQIVAELAAQQPDVDEPRTASPTCTGGGLDDSLACRLRAATTSSIGWSRVIDRSGSGHAGGRFAAAAQLGIQAAEALDHAHRYGVIHRDVKPANLLLDVAGQLWLSDFGLAHVATAPDLTISGTLMGTLRYMSPEQALVARGPIDGRSDVYALGMTLYELLALRPAFDGSSQAELLRQIANQEAPPLHRWNTAIPPDLVTIVHKAIAKEPAERYATAQALADDLRCFLDHRPIQARPPGLPERVSKWARRHRSAVRAGVALMLLFTVILGVSTIWVVRERSEALRQRDLAVKQRRAAEQNLALARAAVSGLLGPAESDGLELIALIRDEIRRAPEAPGTILDKSSLPILDRQLADAFMRTGNVQMLLGRMDDAEVAYRRALEFCRESATPADPPRAFRAGVCCAHLAILLWDRDRHAEAAAFARQATSQWTVAGSAAATAVPAADLHAGIRLATLVAPALIDAGEYGPAESLLQQTLAWTTALERAAPADPRWVRETARVQLNRAQLLLRTGPRTQAEQAARDGLALLEQLSAEHPTEPAFAADLVSARRAWHRCAAGQEPTTSAELRRRLPALTAEAAGAIPWYSEQLAERYAALDVLLFRAGRTDEAQAAAGRAWEHLQLMLADNPSDPRYRTAQGELLLQQAQISAYTWRLRDARAACDHAAAIFGDLARGHPDTARYAELHATARAQRANLDRLEYALELTRLGRESVDGVARAVELARGADLDQLQLAPFALLVHGDYLLLGGDHERAAAVIQRAIAAGPATGAYYHKSLGCALLGCGRIEDARAAFLKAARAWGNESNWPESACPDPWTAAYFLDWVSADRYTNHHAALLWAGHNMAPFALFYVGFRAELEGRREQAISAYQRCAAYQDQPNAHSTAHWAQYRLMRLRSSEPKTGATHQGPPAAERAPHDVSPVGGMQ